MVRISRSHLGLGEEEKEATASVLSKRASFLSRKRNAGERKGNNPLPSYFPLFYTRGKREGQ
jgi:hypothetical protein